MPRPKKVTNKVTPKREKQKKGKVKRTTREKKADRGIKGQMPVIPHVAEGQSLKGVLSLRTVGVLSWKKDYTVGDVNDAFLKMTEFSREEVLGKSLQELTPPEFHEISLRGLDELAARGGGNFYLLRSNIITRMVRADGAYPTCASWVMRWWRLLST